MLGSHCDIPESVKQEKSQDFDADSEEPNVARDDDCPSQPKDSKEDKESKKKKKKDREVEKERKRDKKKK